MLTTFKHDQKRKIKTKKWKKRKDAQTLKNNHGLFLRASRRSLLAFQQKKYFFYYVIFKSNYTINKY